MTIAPKMRYRTQANIDRINAMRAKGMLWDDIAEIVGIRHSTLDGWRKFGLMPVDEWKADDALSAQISAYWQKRGASLSARAFDEAVARETARSVDTCRKHRLHLGLNRADCGGSDNEETQQRRAAAMADKMMREAMARFYANREANIARIDRMAAE